MGLLDTSIQAGQSATGTSDAAAESQARNYLLNKAIKYEQQAGVGELAGIGLGYEAKKRQLAALQRPQVAVVQAAPTQTPMDSQLLGATLLHALKPWHEGGAGATFNLGAQTQYNLGPEQTGLGDGNG